MEVLARLGSKKEGAGRQVHLRPPWSISEAPIVCTARDRNWGQNSEPCAKEPSAPPTTESVPQRLVLLEMGLCGAQCGPQLSSQLLRGGAKKMEC